MKMNPMHPMRDQECYQKIKVPAFFLLRSKLVDVKLRWFDLFKVDSDDSKPKLFHINHVEVEHGLIVTKDEDQPGEIEGEWVEI